MGFTLNPHASNGNGHEPDAYWVQNPDEPDEYYKITPLQNDVHQRLLEKHTRPGRNGQPKVNRETFFKAMYDKILIDWEGIYEDEDKTIPLPCTTETKYALYCVSKERADFIWEEALRLANNDQARKEAERKSFRPVRGTEAESTDRLPHLSSVIREG